MDIKGFKTKDGVVHKYDHEALANIPEIPTDEHINELIDEKLDSGGNVDYVGVEPAEDDIPKFFYGGALPQTKDDTVMPFRYISKTQDISGYCETKSQGTSSMSYAKKNQTTKFYKDADCTEKMKVDFKGWGDQRKFCFKANWIDISHARNIVSARLWGDVVKSRANYAELPELLRTSPNQGAIDGFPVKVYANGVYQGRYTLNIPKDGWMANMDDENEAHCILCGENYVSGCFRAAAKIDESDWSDELHETVPASIKTRWNEVISFVMNATDEEFVANLNQYFDIPSLIDYHLFGLASCGLDAYGKNQIYMTYDGQKWIASMYDMDSTWGLYWNGSKFVATNYARTSYEDMVDGRQGNLLYIRLEKLFYEELQARWAELKNGALSIENIINRFERFTDIAPAELVKEDYASTTGGGKFTGIPSQSTNNIQQIRSFALARQAWTDTYVAGLTPEVEVPCTGISLNTNTLTFTAEGSQTLTATVTPNGCTDTVTWESNNTRVATVNGGLVTAVANGNATITAKCGEYSASCSVAVSGIVEPIPCTGISLDKTELVFDSKGTQTITATVTPTDTTDTVVWSVSPSGVATVNGGVVTAVGDGSCVVTATCGEKSATCTVSVSGVTNVLLYTLPNETELDGTQVIDTGVKLHKNDIDYTIVFDVTPGTQITTSNAAVFACNIEQAPYPGIVLRAKGGANYQVLTGANEVTLGGIPSDTTERFKGVITHKAGGTIEVVLKTESGNAFGYSSGVNACNSGMSETLIIGGAYDTSKNYWRNWVGTVHTFKIYDGVVTLGEMEKILGANLLVDAVWSDSATYKVDTSGNVVSDGTNYVMINVAEVSGGKSRVVLNVADGAYRYLGLSEYDENMVFIKRSENNNNNTSPFHIETQSDTKYVRATAYPNMVSTNNNPATQIAMF